MLHTFYFSVTANVLKVKFLSAYLGEEGLTYKKNPKTPWLLVKLRPKALLVLFQKYDGVALFQN